ncbi:DUF2231 domain-containing protein [Micromonospora okii]|uniref:DUF2231 domain-containing protein n=1 Tax=Micromonospora okii TaxID=1182970 RepID=UPI001E4C120F|nr:DUF2231 domain-containing protein [Micromonospora okii]
MLRDVNGLPTHVLVIHATVVFVPLLALLAAAYGLVPKWRARLGWAVTILAVLTPIVTVVSTVSGKALQETFQEKGFDPSLLAQISAHADYGGRLLWFTLGLAVATILLLLVTRGDRVSRLPSWVPLLLTVVVIALGAAALVYVYLTGDSGAEAAWGQIL